MAVFASEDPDSARRWPPKRCASISPGPDGRAPRIAPCLVFFLVFLPLFGVLLYLIVRGSGMRDRTIEAKTDTKKEFDGYVREQAQSARPAKEPHRLNDLKEKGALSSEEFDKAKAKLLA